MITREEAKSLLGTAYSKINCNCNDKGLCKHQSNPFALELELDKLFDSFEQHINSLKAQLADTKQLTCSTCSTCSHFKEDSNDTDVWEECRLKGSPIEFTAIPSDFGCRYHKPKDTQ